MTRFVHPFARLFSDVTGRALPGAKLYFYVTEDETPKDVYTDAGLTTPHAQPVVANSAGRMPAIFLEAGLYKVVLNDADDNLIWTADPVGEADPSGTYLEIDQNLADVQDAGTALDNLGGVPTTRAITTDGAGLSGGDTLDGDVDLDLVFASEAEAIAGAVTDKPVAPDTLAAAIADAVDAVGGDPGTIYTGSDPDELTYPVGTMLLCAGPRAWIAPNTSVTVRRLSSSVRPFDVNQGAGDALTGTWQARGTAVDSGGSYFYTLVQRTA